MYKARGATIILPWERTASSSESHPSKLIPMVDSVSGGFQTSPEAVLSGMSRKGPIWGSPFPLKKDTSGCR
ncbi:hypothetical protein GUITHDRAFT_151561 [Guillardia theta CCMP2712]|uniref:Uncharacterized protein n=1 Tax=Guillardia theta (strain CCMP2712) TaxID=905079 RepID=L1JN30_GUITC|nr:hypothetical protein GUITHDRAFT_151561 [Guillardia theta CCMP2712]EKX49483.1 hypothetical protein GUITHDRAFT_151561 [Guillardia theta CCMP2712]|eukprot:XP_005836463.1 hypothetical protein GUITHDRAFT_151561 [Guillardia theta CCMP2712]